MIIVGYQGIGKSTLAGTNNCIDLESGNFWVDGKRADDWYKSYCQIANHLSEQGYVVFTSSHEVVRKELEKSKEKVFAVFPAINLKDEWITKLRDRYESTGLEKDFKALANAKDRYKENISELMMGNLKFYEITDMNYDLKQIVDVLKQM
jgi:hypothetical protein